MGQCSWFIAQRSHRFLEGFSEYPAISFFHLCRFQQLVLPSRDPIRLSITTSCSGDFLRIFIQRLISFESCAVLSLCFRTFLGQATDTDILEDGQLTLQSSLSNTDLFHQCRDRSLDNGILVKVCDRKVRSSELGLDLTCACFVESDHGNFSTLRLR